MKTVIYYEWVRKRKVSFIRYFASLGIVLMFFMATMLLDRFSPDFSYNYMKWPQYIRNIMGMRSWHKTLWLDIWQIGCILFAFVINWLFMIELAESIINEKKLETDIFLFNAGVKKREILFGKFVFYFVAYMLEIVGQFILNITYFMIAGTRINLYMITNYHMIMLLIGFINLTFAILFAVLAKKSFLTAKSYSNGYLFGLFVVARIPAIFSFIGSFMSEYDVKGAIIDKMDLCSRVFAGFGDICPIAWCQTYFKVSVVHIVYGLVLGLMVSTVSVLLYNSSKDI